jgi:dihydroxyacetone kinase-like protein
MTDVDVLVRALHAVCREVQERKDELCALDAALGDGDHGVSMAKAFGAADSRLGIVTSQDIGVILQEVGKTLLTAVGGAMGPLFGTAFIEAGKVSAGQTTITPDLVARMLDAAVQGVVRRGRAQPGDKTMLDALEPAARAARLAVDKGCEAVTAARAAAEAAEAGAQATREMVARVGRASRLGERTIGHQDPGATSVAIILAAAVRACQEAA